MSETFFYGCIGLGFFLASLMEEEPKNLLNWIVVIFLSCFWPISIGMYIQRLSVKGN